MIFLDTNIFLRYLVVPVTSNDRIWHAETAKLIDAIVRGDEQATTSEAVLAEVMFVLNSKRQYNLAPTVIASYLEPILRLTTLRLTRGAKRRYLRALEIWSQHPTLGFVGALTAATVMQTDTVLASFDSDFDQVTGIQRWHGSKEISHDPLDRTSGTR